MEIRRSLDVPCSAERLFSWVEDLTLYTQWMPMVHAAQPIMSDSDQNLGGNSGEASGHDKAWNVELRAHVGPFARSKQLRMVRTKHDHPTDVVFERCELDGRGHAPWVLRAIVGSPTLAHGPTALTMELHYGGRLWTGALLQRVLDDEIRQGSEALVGLVSREPTH